MNQEKYMNAKRQRTKAGGIGLPLHVGHRNLPRLFDELARCSSVKLVAVIFLAGTD